MYKTRLIIGKEDEKRPRRENKLFLRPVLILLGRTRINSKPFKHLLTYLLIGSCFSGAGVGFRVISVAAETSPLLPSSAISFVSILVRDIDGSFCVKACAGIH